VDNFTGIRNGEPQNQPIRKYMNPKVITGEPNWNLNKIARIMAKNQIRRLPIVENDQLISKKPVFSLQAKYRLFN
jgi:CBS domain-containing protein